MTTTITKPVALTIAGSDSGGGAGIQADIKSMEANGVFACTVITAVTAQNTTAVLRAYELPLDIIEAQIDAIFADLKVGAVKTGMLSSAAIIKLVARKAKEYDMAPLVVDPVMISKSGFPLLAPEAVTALKRELLPLAALVTPNAHEAAELAGFEVHTISDAERAAQKIFDRGANAVLVKGGHLSGERDAVDVYFDGSSVHHYRQAIIETRNTHGTGCTYAAAIAAHLARGRGLREAISQAKQYVTEAIRNGLSIGAGHGPTGHFYFLQEPRYPSDV